MLLVSGFLIFALSRVEKKKNKAQLPLHAAKEKPCWATEYVGLVPSCEIKDQCDHNRIKGLTVLTVVETTNCHKIQRHVKRKVL